MKNMALAVVRLTSLICMTMVLLAASPATVTEAPPLIDVQDQEIEETKTIRALITVDVVQKIVESGQYELLELSEKQSLELEERFLNEASAFYDRPWVILKAAVGLPNLVAAYVEIFIQREWTIGIGAGTGLLPPVFEGSIRWRPGATCWGCEGRNFLSIGFGLDPAFYFTGPGSSGAVGILLTGSADLTYIHRFAKHFGLMVGSRIGVGAVTEFGDNRNWQKIEPVITLNLLQIGFAF